MYKYYKIYNITDKDMISKVLALQIHDIFDSADTLRVEVDSLEKTAIIYTYEIISYLDYSKAEILLNN